MTLVVAREGQAKRLCTPFRPPALISTACQHTIDAGLQELGIDVGTPYIYVFC